jgi:hypothetical protein
MIRFEFPADRTDIAAAIGQALLEIGGVALNHSVRERVGDVEGENVTTTRYPPEGPNARCVQVTVNASDAEELAELRDSNEMADNSHIEAKIPASQGGTLIETDDIAIGTRPGSVFATDEPGTLPQVDGKGVAFHAAFCGIAAKPFYESGKQSGQWKKRKGVDQAAYDAWYAEQLEQGAAQTTVDTAPVDTAGAFNGDGAEPTHTHAPTTFGGYMVWASAKQNAGLLTQDDIGSAYTAAGLIGIADLLPPNDDAVIAERVAVLYGALSAKAGA